MNYLEQWTFFPDLTSQPVGFHFDKILADDYSQDGTIGTRYSPASFAKILPHLTTVYYNKSALDNLKKSLPFDPIERALEDAMLHGHGYIKLGWQNSLPKPSLPYYSLNV